MDKTIAVLVIVIPVIVMIGVGYILRKKQIVSPEGITGMKSLLMNVCIPATMFKTFYATKFSWQVIVLVVIMFCVTLLAFQFGKLFQKLFKSRQELFPYLTTTFEGGMMGYALFTLLFGSDNLYHIALLDLGNALVLFPIYCTQLRMRQDGTETSPGEVVRNMITPINIAMFSGIIISVIGLGQVISASSFGTVLNETLSFAGGPTSALILIIVGYGLDLTGIKWGETLSTIFSRVIVMGVLGVCVFFLTGVLFPDDLIYRYAAVMFFCLPATYVMSVYPKDQEEGSYVGTVLALYTVITIIGFSVLAAIAA